MHARRLAKFAAMSFIGADGVLKNRRQQHAGQAKQKRDAQEEDAAGDLLGLAGCWRDVKQQQMLLCLAAIQLVFIDHSNNNNMCQPRLGACEASLSSPGRLVLSGLMSVCCSDFTHLVMQQVATQVLAAAGAQSTSDCRCCKHIK